MSMMITDISRKTDIAIVKASIDQLIDPSIDNNDVIRKIEEMTSVLRQITRNEERPSQKIASLISYLSHPNQWNAGKPYLYDLSDPLGTKIQNKLLGSYLQTHKGNCISMPLLVAILGRRIGLEMSLVKAPMHIFVKYKDENGEWINVEATSYGTKRDQSYIDEGHITQKAIKEGTYLRRLSKSEEFVAIAETVLEHLKIMDRQEDRIRLADKLLEMDPRNVEVMLHKGNAYYRLLKRDYLDKFRSFADIPPERLDRYRHLHEQNIGWFAKAEELGWREPSPEDDIKYLDSIKKAKLDKKGVDE